VERRRPAPDDQTRILRIYRQIVSLETTYGLDRLEREERLLFGYLVQEMAKGRVLSIPDLVASGLTSRASTYRHLHNLREAGLVEYGDEARSGPIQLSMRFRSFAERFEKLAKDWGHVP